MDNIIFIKGKVKFTITLDPDIWILDERRKDLNTALQNPKDMTENQKREDYAKKMSRQWERELTEGSVKSPSLVTEFDLDKNKDCSGTYCMLLKPFLENAEPEKDAKILVIESHDEETILPLEIGKEMLLSFSKDGKPLREDGPIHCYFADGSNKKNPIKNVKAFRVE